MPWAGRSSRLRLGAGQAVARLAPRHHFRLVEVDERFLLGPDLVDVDVVVPGSGVPLDQLDVSLGVGPADDELGHVVFGDHLDCRLEVGWCGELLGERSLESCVGPDLERRAPCILLRLRVADRELAIPWLVLAARLLEQLEQLRLRARADQAVADPAGELGRLGRACCDHDRDRIVGQRVDARPLDGVVGAPPRRQLARPQLAHERDRLLEHVEAKVGWRPTVTQHVLVQVLAGADAQEEAAGQHRCGCGGGLRHDRGMDAHRGTGDARADLELVGDGGDATQDAPDERALPLPIDPWVEVVGDECERKARLFRQLRMPHEVERTMLLARQRVSELHE